ncbi:hypothetical protein [Streptomyces mirabilis]|uniref:hypothetical protein n=1 Tax=Streptomyces mirabilis TaxID=68239 RepID=UPI0036915B26
MPLVDSSGETYPFAEVTLLDSETGTPIETPVYLEPIGGAPQTWPILVDPAVVDLWIDTPARVTLQALLPGGASFTRAGVDISPAPAATVRSVKPLHIGSAEGLNSDAMLAVSPDGSAVWQVLNVLKDHRHAGDAPDSTSLGMTDLQDIYPGQTWLGGDISGVQGTGATALGFQAHPNGNGATAIGRAATADEDGIAVGPASAAYVSAVGLGAGVAATKAEQVALGRSASGAAGPNSAVVLGAGVAAEAATDIKAKGVHLLTDGSVVLGNGLLPDLSWVGAPYTAILGSAVVPRYFAARNAVSLAGPVNPLGFFGGAGDYRPIVDVSGITAATVGRDALMSLMAALNDLGMIYATQGAIDDELADLTKATGSTNMSFDTGDADGSKAGDTTRIKRNAVAPGTVTYFRATGIRDFLARVFTWYQPWNPDNHEAEITAHVSPDNVTWTPVKLTWRPLVATAADWYQSWISNTRPIPAGMKYVRLTLDVNSLPWTPQVGRILVRTYPLRNLVLNPTLGTGITNTSYHGYNLTRAYDTTQGFSGTTSIKLTNGSTQSGGPSWTIQPVANQQTVQLGIYAKLPTTGFSAGQIVWRSGTTVLKTQAITPPTTGAWTRFTGSYTLAAGETCDNVAIAFTPTAANLSWNADASLAAVGDTLPAFFDGTSTGGAWEGAVHASVSRLV